MSEWKDIKTAPYQRSIWVRNELTKDNPCLATRGYVTADGVHPDQKFCTTVFTPDRFSPTPAGRLCCPTEWARYEGEGTCAPVEGDQS